MATRVGQVGGIGHLDARGLANQAPKVGLQALLGRAVDQLLNSLTA